MKATKIRASVLSAAVLFAGGMLFGSDHLQWNGFGEAMAATSQHRAEARRELDQITTLLRNVDTAYASGNSAEAETRYEDARSKWSDVSHSISAREAREVQLLFESLGKKLKSGAPASEIKSTVHGMLEELHEDIARELR